VEGRGAAGLDGAAARLARSSGMIQITPQMRVLVAIEPVDGRKGIDSLARLCQEKLAVRRVRWKPGKRSCCWPRVMRRECGRGRCGGQWARRSRVAQPDSASGRLGLRGRALGGEQKWLT